MAPAIRTLSSLLVVALAAGPALATTSYTLTFSKPTNTAPTEVKVSIDPGQDVTVTIPVPCSAVEKRNLIKQALIDNGYDVPATGDGTNQLVIQYLRKGTKVKFTPGKTGEKEDEVVSTAVVSAQISMSSPFFEPFDSEGEPAVFTGGIITDVGKLSVEISAEELGFQTAGPIICQALFQRLAPHAPLYGAEILYLGDRLEVYFDPAYTITQGGVVFGATSLTDGCDGSIQTAPDPCSEDLDGDGIIGLGDLAILLAAYGTSADTPGYDPQTDLNNDGVIDLIDLSLILAAYGQSCAD